MYFIISKHYRISTTENIRLTLLCDRLFLFYLKFMANIGISNNYIHSAWLEQYQSELPVPYLLRQFRISREFLISITHKNHAEISLIWIAYHTAVKIDTHLVTSENSYCLGKHYLYFLWPASFSILCKNRKMPASIIH